MTKSKLIELLQNIEGDPDIFIHPSEECCIDDGITAYAGDIKIKHVGTVYTHGDLLYDDIEDVLEELESSLDGDYFDESGEWLEDKKKEIIADLEKSVFSRNAVVIHCSP